jgi:hypothetical protein
MLREKILATPIELRSKVKAEEIVKAVKIKKGKKLSFKKKRDYEIVEIQQLENGVALFARVFENGKQIGFGDGTVDIERFIFINPPLLVDDENGDIVEEYQDKEGVKHVRKLREDPVEAIKLALENTVDVMKNKFDNSKIIQGKTGNTTTTVYPAYDAYLGRENSSDTWTAMRDAATSEYQGQYPNTTNTYAGFINYKSGSFRSIERAFWTFDTSSVPDSDTISSASINLKMGTLTGGNPDSCTYHIVSVAPASKTSVASGDYDSFGTTSWGSVALSTITSTNTYYTWTLDSNGIANISKTGNDCFGMRMNRDIDNSEPTGINRRAFFYVAATGTTSDPYLTMEHAAAATFIPLIMMS